MIEINNLTKYQINQRFLKKVAEKVLKQENKLKLELSIALIGEKIIQGLNKKYRKKNKPTDVLSFFYGDNAEIVICLDQVKKNARKFNSDFQKELTKVLIHGILHAVGYCHEKNKKQAEEMEKKQLHYLFYFLTKT